MTKLLYLLLLIPTVVFAGPEDQLRDAYTRYIQCRAGCSETLESETEKTCSKETNGTKLDECYQTANKEHDSCKSKCEDLRPK